jgi:hypothetical protein
MTMGAKTEVMKEALAEYLVASREMKGVILDRLVKTVKMHRKAVVRRLKVLQLRATGINHFEHRGRPVQYGKDVTAALKEVWEIGHEMCAERLHEVIGEYVDVLMRDGMWNHNDVVTHKLRRMSVGTMKSRLATFDRVVRGGGRSMTKPSHLKEIIPVRRGPWKDPDPGCGEIDTVAHCGNTAEGSFGFTVQYTDIALSWCFLEAQMGKDTIETTTSLERMRIRSPFLLKWLDPDTGSEFISWVAQRWSVEHHIELTRIRPGEKNDHGHIEQKNDKNVRMFAGYIRIDTDFKLKQLKTLLAVVEVYVNHFLPTMQCVEKIRTNISHSSRKYDKAQTPYQRLMAHKKIPKEAKAKMKTLHATLNPKKLHDAILAARKNLFRAAKFTRSDI